MEAREERSWDGREGARNERDERKSVDRIKARVLLPVTVSLCRRELESVIK